MVRAEVGASKLGLQLDLRGELEFALTHAPIGVLAVVDGKLVEIAARLGKCDANWVSVSLGNQFGLVVALPRRVDDANDG